MEILVYVNVYVSVFSWEKYKNKNKNLAILVSCSGYVGKKMPKWIEYSCA